MKKLLIVVIGLALATMLLVIHTSRQMRDLGAQIDQLYEDIGDQPPQQIMCSACTAIKADNACANGAVTYWKCLPGGSK